MEWPRKAISEIARHSLGKMLDKAKNRGDLKPYLRNFNVRWFEFDLSDLSEMRFLPGEEERYTAVKGDILICEGGYPGRAAIWDNDTPIYFQKALHRVRFHESQRGKWFLYYLYSKDLDGTLKKHFNGAGIQHFTGETLAAFEVPLPPLLEQQRIVRILDEAFDGIATAKANAEKNLQNARALFESHLHREHLEKISLDELVDIKTGKLDANAAVEGGQYPFFTCSREIYEIDDYAFDCEAILLAGNNAVGDFNVKHYNGKFNAYQRTYVITVNEKKRVLYRFLYFQMLKSLKKFKSQSVGVGTKFLKLGMIKNMEIALPSLAEQRRLVSTMDALLAETQHLEFIYQKKLAALDELKKSLLHQAFNGQL
jgi:type I restriction enzyme S subunit